MMHIQAFAFNPFSENTYVIFDDARRGAIIDPGCYFPEEEETLFQWVKNENLTIEKILLTHAHIDHILGAAWAKERFPVPMYAHEKSVGWVTRMPEIGKMYGIPCRPSPQADFFLAQNDSISVGCITFEVLFCPGHSPDSIVFHSVEEKVCIVGDVLFNRSIGRTDLPGGNFDELADSIRNQLYTLPDETRIFCGHGDDTTIGEEKLHNPFVRES